jgi:hypothetical protein
MDESASSRYDSIPRPKSACLPQAGEDRDGNKKQITKVIGSKMQMLRTKKVRNPGEEDPSGGHDDVPFAYPSHQISAITHFSKRN